MLQDLGLRNSVLLLKLLIIGFWALWFTIVLVSNTCDALKSLGLLSQNWSFASGNFDMILKTTEIYRLPIPIVGFLFALVIIWEALCVGLFWWALRSFKSVQEPRGLWSVDIAFIAALILFAGFMLMDEIFVSYMIEGTHMRFFLEILISVLVIHLLPDKAD